MLSRLRQFIDQPTPRYGEALGLLRMLFAATFVAQSGVAALLALILSLFADSSGAIPLLARIIVVLSLLQLPLGATLAGIASRPGGKGAALSAVIMAGVILATPAWFLAFALLVKVEPIYLAILLVILVNAYALGFLLCGRFAKTALRPGPNTPKKNPDNLAEQAQG